jgi:hypothetical protein
MLGRITISSIEPQAKDGWNLMNLVDSSSGLLHWGCHILTRGHFISSQNPHDGRQTADPILNPEIWEDREPSGIILVPLNPDRSLNFCVSQQLFDRPWNAKFVHFGSFVSLFLLLAVLNHSIPGLFLLSILFISCRACFHRLVNIVFSSPLQFCDAVDGRACHTLTLFFLAYRCSLMNVFQPWKGFDGVQFSYDSSTLIDQ